MCVHAHEGHPPLNNELNAALKTKINKLLICCCSPPNSPCYYFLTLCGRPLVKVYLDLGQSVPGVEAVMAYVLQELLLYCCLAAFVTGIVLAAATLIS